MNSAFNILLAEDNEDDVFLLHQAFKKAAVDSRLHAVKNGAQALAYLKGESPYEDSIAHPFPDILLLDLNMPGMNGFEFLERLRLEVDCRRLLVHVLSASARDADVLRAYDLRVNSYVLKPTRVDELVDFVKALHQWHRFVSRPPAAG